MSYRHPFSSLPHPPHELDRRVPDLSNGTTHLSRLANEIGITDDLADGSEGVEGPGALAGVAESSIGLAAAVDGDGVAHVVEDLAALGLVGDELADGQRDGLEGPAGTDGSGLLVDAGLDLGLAGLLGGVVAEDDAQVQARVFRVDLLEGGVAGDAGDAGGCAEGPGALAGVGEGDVRVGAALFDDGLAVAVECLAPEVLWVDVLADLQLDLGEGPSVHWGHGVGQA